MLGLGWIVGLAGGEVEVQIERLGAARVEERERAQRWLAEHLTVAEFGVVAEGLGAGNAEVRGRLIEAVAAQDGNLELAVLAATDVREEVRSGGRAAVEEMVARWNPGTLKGAEAGLLEEWAEEHTRVLVMELGSSSLADVIDRLVRLGGGPASVVLDPTLDPALFARLPEERLVGERAIGAWPDMLGRIAAAWRVSLEVHGRGEGRASGAWVRVCKRGTDGKRRGVDHVVEWCEGVLRELDPRWNQACARALGALGWPAAVRWLEARWLERGDEAALEGLLVAAARGRVSPGLAAPEAVRALLGDLDARLEQSEPGSYARANRLAAALFALGPTASGGESIADLLVEGWEQAGPASRWVRLVGLEGTRGLSPRGEACCMELLGSTERAPLRIQAVQTLLALSGSRATHPVIAEPRELLAWAHERSFLDDLVRALTALRAPYPGDPASIAGERPEALVLAELDWAAHAGDWQAALHELERLTASDAGLESVSQRMREWVELGSADVTDGLLAAAGAAEGDRFGEVPLERLALRCGRLEEARTAALLERLAALPSPTPVEARDLGELCAHASLGWKAREALIEWIRPEVSAPVVGAALERAILALRRARSDLEVTALERRARERSVRLSHPLVDVLLGPDWPPRPPLAPRDLDALDHHLDL